MNYDFYQPGIFDVSRYEPEFLPQGNFPARSDMKTIEKGQKLKAGSVLGIKSATGKLVLCSKLDDKDQPIADGSEMPFCVLKVSVDTTAAERVCPIWRTGAFLGPAMTVGKGYTVWDLDIELGKLSIFLEKEYNA